MSSLDTPQIGPGLQALRKAHKLTLEQLAAASGVSRSMLSQIERGQANPTFAVLWSLTRALGVEFSDLFSEGPHPVQGSTVEVVTIAHTPEIRSADGTCKLRILSPPQLAGRTEWYDVTIRPGGALESTAHAVGTFEHFTAWTAGFEIRSGDSSQSLGVGETARYPADVPHKIANVSDQDAKGLLVVLYR